VLPRHHAYAGVLVDDLVGRDHQEPYRMFTSRAEHRLLLGVDSARERLMEVGVRLGLVPERVFHVEQRRWERRGQVRCELEDGRLNPTTATREMVQQVAGVTVRCPCSWADVLRREDVDAERVAASLQPLRELPAAERRTVVASLRYRGYIERAEREWARLERLGGLTIPSDLDYSAIGGLSREVVEALSRSRPRTLAEAERLAGVTPAAMAILAARLAAQVTGGNRT
jgi:tRNA uridine 5-carboxymethylaminomethyl modification enzyme